MLLFVRRYLYKISVKNSVLHDLYIHFDIQFSWNHQYFFGWDMSSSQTYIATLHWSSIAASSYYIRMIWFSFKVLFAYQTNKEGIYAFIRRFTQLLTILNAYSPFYGMDFINKLYKQGICYSQVGKFYSCMFVWETQVSVCNPGK